MVWINVFFRAFGGLGHQVNEQPCFFPAGFEIMDSQTALFEMVASYLPESTDPNTLDVLSVT